MLAPLAALGAMVYTALGQYGLKSLRPPLSSPRKSGRRRPLRGHRPGPSPASQVFTLTRLLAYLRDELLITAGTSSSEAVLAPVMPAGTARLLRTHCRHGDARRSHTSNADGTSIYLGMGAIFLAQATNTHLTLRDQITLLLDLMLTSKGSAGVATQALRSRLRSPLCTASSSPRWYCCSRSASPTCCAPSTSSAAA